MPTTRCPHSERISGAAARPGFSSGLSGHVRYPRTDFGSVTEPVARSLNGPAPQGFGRLRPPGPSLSATPAHGRRAHRWAPLPPGQGCLQLIALRLPLLLGGLRRDRMAAEEDRPFLGSFRAAGGRGSGVDLLPVPRRATRARRAGPGSRSTRRDPRNRYQPRCRAKNFSVLSHSTAGISPCLPGWACSVFSAEPKASNSARL